MYKQIFENLPESIVVCKEDFSIIKVNKSFANISLYSQKVLVNKNINELFVNQNEFSEDIIHENELITKENKILPIQFKVKKEKDLIIFLISPLSETTYLNQTHIDFISTVSHELRTPLTSIKGFADTLLMAGDKLDKAKQQRFISIIKNQIERLTRLVENLLTVSKLESKNSKSVIKSIDIKEFFDDLLVTFNSKLNKHKLSFKIQENIQHLWADSDKLEQIMTNLIDNAIKYSPENSQICIKVNEIDNDNIQIQIKDEGIGIPEKNIKNIFNKFSRIDNPLTRKAEGTGLGLYITKSLIESLNGIIVVKSNTPNKGTTFNVKLPIATNEKHLQEKFLNKGNQ